jgi:hypothetical protein
VISELGFGPRYSALIYNPFQMLGFSDEANLFIINDTATTSINSCLNQHCTKCLFQTKFFNFLFRFIELNCELCVACCEVFVGLVNMVYALNLELVTVNSDGQENIVMVTLFNSIVILIYSFDDLSIVNFSFLTTEDVDECELGIHECDPLVVCINTLGGYECGPCPPGYHDVFGNGRLCKGFSIISISNFLFVRLFDHEFSQKQIGSPKP